MLLINLPRELIGLIVKTDIRVYHRVVQLNKRFNKIAESEALKYYSEFPILESELCRYIIPRIQGPYRRRILLYRPFKENDTCSIDTMLSIESSGFNLPYGILISNDGVEVDLRTTDQWFSLSSNDQSYIVPINEINIVIHRYYKKGYQIRDVSAIFDILSDRRSCLKLHPYYALGETLDRYHDYVDELLDIRDESVRISVVISYLSSTRTSLINYIEEDPELRSLVSTTRISEGDDLGLVAEEIEKEIEEVYLSILNREDI